ncbi:unnamed protein product [Cercospora beticola]|nr:unnamed protein product [Cercospora beticola]
MATTTTTQCTPNRQAEENYKPERLPEHDTSDRAPRIGFTQLLLPLFLAWISNCQKTMVVVLPTIIARIIQAAVLVSLLNYCGDSESTRSYNGRRTTTRSFGFFIQALCVLFMIDILRLDPTEARGLVSTSDWRSETAELFRR